MGWGQAARSSSSIAHCGATNCCVVPSKHPAVVNVALADEVSSVALMTLGQLYLDQGDHDVAKTALIQALDRQSIDAATLAGLRFRWAAPISAGPTPTSTRRCGCSRRC